MKPATETRKLAELRPETDRQLVNLITCKLERGSALLRSFDEEASAAAWDSVDEAYRRAEDAYYEAVGLATALYALPGSNATVCATSLNNCGKLWTGIRRERTGAHARRVRRGNSPACVTGRGCAIKLPPPSEAVKKCWSAGESPAPQAVRQADPKGVRVPCPRAGALLHTFSPAGLKGRAARRIR